MPETWHAVDVRTGRRGPQLHTKTRGSVSRIVGAVTDTTLQVSCQTLDPVTGATVPFPEWRSWTQPGRIMAVCCDDNDRPLWGGLILRRVPDETEWAPLSLATLEHYLDRRFGGTAVFTQVDQATIASTLVQATITNQGIPFTIDAPPTGVLRDRSYYDSDDKTVLTLLKDLMNIQNGVEFTVDLEWSNPPANSILRIVLRIRTRIGTAASTIKPPARFEYPGAIASFSVPEDYGKDTGANDVMAVSSGEGGDPAAGGRPQSPHAVDTAGIAIGMPRYERRFTPSTSITSVDTLAAYARAELSMVKNGLTELELSLQLDSGPRLNADWWLGDDVSAAITSPAFPERVASDNTRLPGYERTVRVVGWTADLDARKLTPSLRETNG